MNKLIYLGLAAVGALALTVGCNAVPKESGPAAKWTQKEFIITMWCAPLATEENVTRLESEGFNLTNVSWGRNDARIASNAALKLLDNTDKHDFKAFIGNATYPFMLPGTLDDPSKKAQLDAFIDEVKKHPSFAGYFLADEPSATTFTEWGRIVQYLRERDPEHPAYINLFPTYANQRQLGVLLNGEQKIDTSVPDNFAGNGSVSQTIQFYNQHLDEYIDKVKPAVLSYDHYHFLRNGADGTQYFLNLALIRNAAIKAKIPFINIVQASSIEKSWRAPSKNELRWLAYTTMAYGGRGIGWFLYSGPTKYGGLYQDGKRMPSADWVAEINHEVKILGRELMKLNSCQVYHSSPLPLGAEGMEKSSIKVMGGQYVIGTFKENEKLDAFMVVNRDYNEKSSAKLSIAEDDVKLMEFSTQRGEWTAIESPVSDIVIDLPPGGGKLFKIKR